MTGNQRLSGRCACGEVTFSVKAPKTYGACHCKMCRRWCGGVWMGVVCEKVLELDGPVESWISSKIASRGFCKACGSSIWHKPKHSKCYTFGQGLFDDQSEWAMRREICSDDQPSHYHFADSGQKAFTAWGTFIALIFGRLPK